MEVRAGALRNITNNGLQRQPVSFGPLEFIVFFLQLANPVAGGKLSWSTKGERRVIYRLPVVLQTVHSDQPVYIVEGEKSARRVRLVNLPDLSPKEDVWDWLEAGHITQELLARVNAAENYDPATNRILSPYWLDMYLCDDRGQPIPNVANVLLALRANPAYSDLFAYNQIVCLPYLMQPLGPQVEPFTPRSFTDEDVPRIPMQRFSGAA